MFWKKKQAPMPETERLNRIAARFRAMSAARKMLESGTDSDRVMVGINLDAEGRIAANRPALPFTFRVEPASRDARFAADRYLELRAETLTEPSSQFTLRLVLPDPADAELAYDRRVAEDPNQIAEPPPFQLRLEPAPDAAPVPRLRGEIARIFDSFESGIDLVTRTATDLTATVTGANLIRPDTTHAYVQPDHGEWQLFRILDPVDFFLAINLAKGWGEFSSKGAIAGERNPGKLLAYAVA